MLMDKLVSHNKSGILKGRMLVDGVVATNEVIDLTKRIKQVCFTLMINGDLESKLVFSPATW